MENKMLYVIIFVVVLAIGYKVLIVNDVPSADRTDSTNYQNTQGAVIPNAPTDAQIVIVGMKGANYVFNPAQVQANKPVTLRSDGTLRGCGNYMIQRDLGINSNIANGDITFTPKKAGSYRIACSMNMYSGNLVVV